LEQAQRWRLLLVGLAVTASSVLILQRLSWYQITDHPRFAVLASEEHQARRTLTPKRGALLDTRGYPIALSVMYDAVYVYRPEIPSLDKAATLLSEALGMDRGEVLDRLRSADRHWTLLASRVPANAAGRIEAARMDGVDLRRIPAREYPEGSLAAQVLGFVGAEGRGLSGLELTLDAELAGKPGVVITERDTAGSEITIGRKALVPAVPGSDVVLTIDRYLQRMAERELAAAVTANKATGGAIIVMEPATGAILAMAALPTFSLTAEPPGVGDAQERYKPVAVTNTYEPGSVMKLITVAAAIEEQAVSPDTTYLDTGVAVVQGTPIRNWDGRGYGTVTVRQILMHSLNTGAQWVASRVGPERFYRYLEAFGFGAATGVRLNGEAPGSFRRVSDPGWAPVDLATNSFGQSIAVTPLQMITAVSALANDGVLMQPQLVRETRGPDGVQATTPHSVRRVVSSRTADTMVNMMVSVWGQPALQAHRVEGYTLAAKSGTADIPGPGGYQKSQTYASFVGFGPIPNPRFAILVRIDRPEALYGGVVAAPVFRAVAKELLAYFRIPGPEAQVPTPEVGGARAEAVDRRSVASQP
jgi:cell division protein FtsI/penicillin-binding protein 2